MRSLTRERGAPRTPIAGRRARSFCKGEEGTLSLLLSALPCMLQISRAQQNRESRERWWPRRVKMPEQPCIPWRGLTGGCAGVDSTRGHRVHHEAVFHGSTPPTEARSLPWGPATSITAQARGGAPADNRTSWYGAGLYWPWASSRGPQPLGHGLALPRGLLGTGPHSRR
uniref:Uncharacterized protein n=1 Tax=Rousettus aegyptiacus TaxID=9407 RepID=A0A7J8D6B0_ROUAE|nr:hypothetical protein HJG63_008816 [Rousettus aegyptiacus]